MQGVIEDVFFVVCVRYARANRGCILCRTRMCVCVCRILERIHLKVQGIRTTMGFVVILICCVCLHYSINRI